MQDENLSKIRHSLAHLLASAILKNYPDAKPTLGPAIENGFYYDFEFKSNKPSDDDLKKIEKEMRKVLPSWKGFEKMEVTADEARERFKDNPYKLELIDEIEKKGEKITLYKSGEFVDLCRGGHSDNLSAIDTNSFKLSHVAGAYWRGDENNPMLTRIYGLAFEDKEKLDQYLQQLEEARKRDHKKLGPELDLFTFSDLVGAGLPLWTPRGTLIRDLLESFVWKLREERGYVRVDIPHITKKALYEKSGHWDKFKDDLFRIMTREGHEFAMKPMNCPHHTQIYARKLWSYRDLPQRYANTTKVYRDEQSGELAGLSRVRSITQDDAHVFCRAVDVKEEMAKIWDIIQIFYGAFGFDLSVRLSLHDPNNMEAYLGTPSLWEKAETELRELVKEKGATAEEAVGEAAFYGPKVDFMGKDSLGRQWQVATIQLDVNMPDRFDLTCVNEKGEKERIVMIHAAIMGSIERFLAVLIEHYAGAFPLWLSPVQVKILPVAESHSDYAEAIHNKLKGAGIRSEITLADESLGKRIRNSKIEKIPYLLVIGDKEIESNKVEVEKREEGSLGQMSPEELISKLQEEIKNKK